MQCERGKCCRVRRKEGRSNLLFFKVNHHKVQVDHPSDGGVRYYVGSAM